MTSSAFSEPDTVPIFIDPTWLSDAVKVVAVSPDPPSNEPALSSTENLSLEVNFSSPLIFTESRLPLPSASARVKKVSLLDVY